MNYNRVLYETLCPSDFSDALSKCPIAYLPLGTLEWHGPHLPLGADGIQSEELFKRVALKIGGIVFPKLFLGPDRFFHDSEKDLYGMDIDTGDAIIPYTMQQLPGSCYWVSDYLFEILLFQIARNIKRAGFSILVAHGHGPSNNSFKHLRTKIEKDLHLSCISPLDFISEEKLKYQNDHAAANETSITMAVRPELVHMEYLSDPSQQIAMAGDSPILHASKLYGEEILDANVKFLSNGLTQKLKELNL